MRNFTLCLAMGLLTTAPVVAGDSCPWSACDPAQVSCHGSENQCGRCRSAGCCNKVCRVVCEMKEVKKTVWEVKCSDFCPALPGCARGDCCGQCQSGCPDEASCGSCDCGCGKDPCEDLRRPLVPPRCGKVRTKKELVKKEITCKVPVYKCEVVYLCGGCCAACGVEPSSSPSDAAPGGPAPQQRLPEPAPLPPPPKRAPLHPSQQTVDFPSVPPALEPAS